MAEEDFEMRLTRGAKTSLQTFKDQSLLRRRFGDDAVRLYNSCEGTKTALQLMDELGMSEEAFVSILEYMNNNGMVSVSQGPASKITPPQLSRISPPAISPSAAYSPPSQSTFARTPPIPPRKSERQGMEEEGLGGKPAAGDEEIEEKEDESGEAGEGIGPSRGKSARFERGIGGNSPADEREKDFSPRASQEEKKEADVSLMSPLEKVLYEKHGELGVQIYNLIDGEKTAEEILRQTGVSESKLVEILEFMDEQGIIKLEKPPSSEPEPSDETPEEPPAEKKPEPAREPRFKPIIEEDPEEKPFVAPKAPPKVPNQQKEEEEEADELLVPVDVPAMAKLSLTQQAVLFAELATRFGKSAQELVKHIDGKHDFVELSLSCSLSFFDIDTILAYFGKKGFVTFRQLTRDEIKKRYGEDGFAIFKRYGRDGLLLYEMIGKEASMKDIIVKSKLDPNRAIDIFVFIHKALGLDIPLEKNIIYRQLGLKK